MIVFGKPVAMRPGRVLGLLAVGLAVVFATGCGSGGGSSSDGSSTESAGTTTTTAAASDLARGRQLFQTAAPGNSPCGFCHTLAAAATVGSFAVNLDDEFSLDRKQGWTDTRVRDEVLTYLEQPPCYDENTPNRCMPKDLYKGDDADAVADFVARCAGRAGKGDCRPVAGGLRGKAAEGERLYSTIGCVTCHWSVGKQPVAPSLYGLAGSEVELDNGNKVTATSAYLLESILAPDAAIVEGYRRGSMSGRVRPGQVTAAQARALVSYIDTLK